MDSVKIPENIVRMMGKMYIVVIRWNGQEFKFSKPCNHCIKYLRKIGIKKIYYSLDDGSMKYEKLKYMESDHVCIARKVFG